MIIGEPVRYLMLNRRSGAVLLAVGSLLVYYRLPERRLLTEKKAVFITGCDSGFGHALARRLDGIGITVYAACLRENGPGATELRNTCSDKLKVIQLDVTDGEQIRKAYEYVKKDLGERGLWGLVNNAGVCYVAEIEMTPETVFRRTIDVNLYGTIRVTKSFLPLLRRSRGRVVNVSSLTGKVGFEGFGAYCASKFGIEGYSDVLRLEMRKWGVAVSVIQPSGYQTGALTTQAIHLRKNEIWTNLDQETKAIYGEEYFNKIYDNFEASVPRYPKDLSPVTDVMCSALLAKRPRERYAVGTGAGTLINIFPMMPVWMSDHIVRMLGLGVRELQPIGLQMLL